jgi:hypothetical protein
VDLVEGVQPLLGLGRVYVRKVVLELVEIHGSGVSLGRRQERRH